MALVALGKARARGGSAAVSKLGLAELRLRRRPHNDSNMLNRPAHGLCVLRGRRAGGGGGARRWPPRVSPRSGKTPRPALGGGCVPRCGSGSPCNMGTCPVKTDRARPISHRQARRRKGHRKSRSQDVKDTITLSHALRSVSDSGMEDLRRRRLRGRASSHEGDGLRDVAAVLALVLRARPCGLGLRE